MQYKFGNKLSYKHMIDVRGTVLGLF